jgi:hypothetical protein
MQGREHSWSAPVFEFVEKASQSSRRARRETSRIVFSTDMLSKEDLFFIQHSPRVLDRENTPLSLQTCPAAKPPGALRQAAIPLKKVALPLF